jgi:type III secretion protein D
MKRIRILTGKHAGASLELEVGNYSIGANSDDDISITDWTAASLRLLIDANGNVQCTQLQAENDAHGDAEQSGDQGTAAVAKPAPKPYLFKDLKAYVFGDIMLCVGPSDQAWPADMQLLDASFNPPPALGAGKPKFRLRSGITLIIIMLSTLTMSVIGNMSFADQSSRHAASVETVATTAQRLRVVLDLAYASALKIDTTPSSVVITGLLDSNQQVGPVRAAITRLNSKYPIIQNYAVATEVAESIRSSIGLPNAKVTYFKEGIFIFSADVADVEATTKAIQRVQADLVDVVKHIDVNLVLTPKKLVEPPVLSSLADDDISVVQTLDGQKHLVVIEPSDPLATPPRLAIQATNF